MKVKLTGIFFGTNPHINARLEVRTNKNVFVVVANKARCTIPAPGGAIRMVKLIEVGLVASTINSGGHTSSHR